MDGKLKLERCLRKGLEGGEGAVAGAVAGARARVGGREWEGGSGRREWEARVGIARSRRVGILSNYT